MTPEERAADLRETLALTACEDVIVAAIRAAENGALERAAKVLDNGSFLHSEAPTAVWARQVSALIRDLKHVSNSEAVRAERWAERT